MQIKIKIVSCCTANSKPVKQEVSRTVILPPLVFPGLSLTKKAADMSKTSAHRRACLASMENISSLLIYYIYGWSLYVLISMIPMLGFPSF